MLALLTVTGTPCGYWHGAPLFRIVLQNDELEVHLTNLGATIMAVYAPDKDGVKKNVVAGFAKPVAYADNPAYFGCTVGRYANRIAAGRFTLDGQVMQLPVNNGPNHLHGGVDGFHKKVWQVTGYGDNANEVWATFTYRSQDGEEGYPGNMDVSVRYSLDIDNYLWIEYSAVTDKRTPVSLTNHSYFNLSGFEQAQITNHLLQVNTGYYTEKSELNVPTGRILPVDGTALDFTEAKPIGDGIAAFPADKGYDHNFVLKRENSAEIVEAALLQDPVSGRVVKVLTDMPGIQVYTANWWEGEITGQQGVPYVQYGAVALETQSFPDSPNHPEFPGTILEPGETYERTTAYLFAYER